MFKKDLGIVICNFNKIDYLRDCLESISCANFDDLTYDIIVVDNASTDGSEQMVIEEFPYAILLQTGSNLGGAGGFARGMQYALDNKYMYVCIQDNDTKVDKNVYQLLKKELDRNALLGIAGANILQMDHPERIQELGARIDYFNYKTFLNFKNEILNRDISTSIKCDYVPACCLMTKYSILRDVGVFDKNYFIYWDDIDWCTRVKKAGYEIEAFRDAKVWHKGGAKLVENTFSTYYYNRNRYMFFSKYLDEKNFLDFKIHSIESIKNLKFFSNYLKNFNSVISILMSFEDLASNMMGKNDNSIFIKDNLENELQNIFLEFEKIGLIKTNNIDLESFNEIKNQFKDKVIEQDESLELTSIDCLIVLTDKIFEDLYSNLNIKIYYMNSFKSLFEHERISSLIKEYVFYSDAFENIDRKIYENKFNKIRKDLK